MVCPLGAGESGIKTSGKKPCNLVGEQQLYTIIVCLND